jgi:hypothetical protein
VRIISCSSSLIHYCWQKGKTFPIIYPENYLEAKRLKEEKAAEGGTSSGGKKRKADDAADGENVDPKAGEVGRL